LDDYIIPSYFTQEKAEELKRKLNSINIEDRNCEKEFLKRIVKFIDILPKENDLSNTNHNGSLYNLFTSQYFNIDMIISYLNKKEDNGYIDCLVNQIHNRYIHESFFYLSQLWYNNIFLPNTFYL
jgi:hypothetical protein